MNRDDILALVRRQAAAWERTDAQSVSRDFAPEGVFITPSGRWQGPENIQKVAEMFFANAINIAITINRIVIDGEHGAIEWTWHETDKKTGNRHVAEDAIIFRVDLRKITYWREYIDSNSTH